MEGEGGKEEEWVKQEGRGRREEEEWVKQEGRGRREDEEWVKQEGRGGDGGCGCRDAGVGMRV